MILDSRQRLVVHRTIEQVSVARGWSAGAINVRTNHVHVVLSGSAAPEHMLNALKSWCTRRLREAGLVHRERRTWSRHGSTLYLWSQTAVVDACAYVREQHRGGTPEASAP
ncbi:MAG: hypothetical protein QM820_37625 [Minicystis sp.]